MLEQFGNYPEIKWMAETAARFFSGGDKFQVNPDLENFKLVRFKDLRKHPKISEEHYFKLMLIGNSKTNVFIDGPDSRMDEIIKRLPKYVGKSWLEIKNMSLERNSLDCKNVYTSVCKLGNNEKSVKQLGKEAVEVDLSKEDEICANCDRFEPK